jgi:hypothetical protein
MARNLCETNTVAFLIGTRCGMPHLILALIFLIPGSIQLVDDGVRRALSAHCSDWLQLLLESANPETSWVRSSHLICVSSSMTWHGIERLRSTASHSGTAIAFRESGWRLCKATCREVHYVGHPDAVDVLRLSGCGLFHET